MLPYNRALTRSGKPSTRIDCPKLLLETPCTLGGAPVMMLAKAGLVRARYTVIAPSGATACASAILLRKGILARRKACRLKPSKLKMTTLWLTGFSLRGWWLTGTKVFGRSQRTHTAAIRIVE